MALTPEQLQQAVMRYRGGVDLSGGSLQPQPMDPALTQPLTPMVDAPAPMPVVQPLAPSSVSAMNPGSYRQGIQQSIDAYRGATNEAMANAQAMGGAKSSNADRIADLYASRADEIGADAGPDRTASTASRAAADEKMAAYEAANKEAENTQIQRDRRTDGQKAMGVIGMALAGLGDAMSRRGGQSSNYLQNVQQTIQDEIQRDVDDQRAALQDKRAAAQSRLSEYGLARQAFGDDKDAEDRAYNLAMSKATMRHAAQVDEYAARAESETAKLGANALSAKLKSDAALQELQAWQGLEEQRMRSMGRGGGGQQGMSPELQYRIERDKQLDAQKAEARQIPGLMPARGLSSVTDQQYKEASDVMSTYGKLENNLAAMKKIATGDYSLVSTSPVEQFKKLQTAKSEYSLLRETTTAMLTQASGSGVPGAQEALRVF